MNKITVAHPTCEGKVMIITKQPDEIDAFSAALGIRHCRRSVPAEWGWSVRWLIHLPPTLVRAVQTASYDPFSSTSGDQQA